MSDTHTHKHWCTDHKSVGEDSCFTQFIVYDNGEEEKTELEEGSFGAQLKAVGGWPSEVAWVSFIVSQDETDEEPLIDLHFFEAGNYEPISTLHLEMDGLKEFHSNLADAMKRIS